MGKNQKEKIWFSYTLLDDNHKRIIGAEHVPYEQGMQTLQDTVAVKIMQHDEQMAQAAQAELDPMQGAEDGWWTRATNFVRNRKR